MLDGVEAQARAKQANESAKTARPVDRCAVCRRPFVDGRCFWHPEGHDPVAEVKAAYRAAMAAHSALDEEQRAAVRAWLDGVTVL